MKKTKPTPARYTIYHIKRILHTAGINYFSRANMKFWKQTLKDFKVVHIASRVFCYSKSACPDHPGHSFFEFFPEKRDIYAITNNNITDIENYLNNVRVEEGVE